MSAQASHHHSKIAFTCASRSVLAPLQLLEELGLDLGDGEVSDPVALLRDLALIETQLKPLAPYCAELTRLITENFPAPLTW